MDKKISQLIKISLLTVLIGILMAAYGLISAPGQSPTEDKQEPPGQVKKDNETGTASSGASNLVGPGGNNGNNGRPNGNPDNSGHGNGNGVNGRPNDKEGGPGNNGNNNNGNGRGNGRGHK